jgi:hypothetical protein
MLRNARLEINHASWPDSLSLFHCFFAYLLFLNATASSTITLANAINIIGFRAARGFGPHVLKHTLLILNAKTHPLAGVAQTLSF